MADRIIVDTEYLTRWAKSLSDVAGALADASARAASIPLDRQHGSRVGVSVRVKLRCTPGSYAASTAGEALPALGRALKTLSAAASRFSEAAKTAASDLATAEARLTSDINGTQAGSDTNAFAAGAAGGVMHAIAADVKAAVEKAIASRPSVEERIANWGKEPGSISDVEYAYLCMLINQASQKYSKAEDMKAYVLKQIKQLPENHPLRSIDPSRIEVLNSLTGLQTLVIKIDSKNAVVVFAGTDPGSARDYLADIAIAFDNQIGLNVQSVSAYNVVHDLEKAGYTNIQVAGHSLGGYLAIDVALACSSVKECTTFDAPQHDAISSRVYQLNSRKDVITNYRIMGSSGWKEGSIVSSDYLGLRKPIGETIAVDTDSHKIKNIFNAMSGGDGMSAINRLYKEDGEDGARS